MLSAGSMKVLADDRIEVVDDGRELLVRGIKRADRGKYSCTVNLKLEPVSLSHQVEVLSIFITRQIRQNNMFDILVKLHQLV